MDDDGKNRDKLLPVKVKVIIEGDTLTIDVTGSSDEVETAFNSPYEGAVLSAATYIVRTIFLDEVDPRRLRARRTRGCCARCA